MAKTKKDTKKINMGVYKEMRGMGMSQVKAYELAGGQGKNADILASNASTYEKKMGIKGDITKLMREKRMVALKALTKAKTEKESFRNLAIAIGILTEKIQLLEGKPTSQTAAAVKIYLPERNKEISNRQRAEYEPVGSE